jgi:hypothetical protein
MRKIIISLCIVLTGYGLNAQIVAWNFSNALGSEPEYEPAVKSAGLNASSLYRGGSLKASSSGQTFATQGFTANGTKDNALSNDEYLWFSIDAQQGFVVSVFTLDARLMRTADGPTTYRWYYSVNDVDFFPVGDKDITLGPGDDGIIQPAVILYRDSSLQKVTQRLITFRLYAWGAASSAGSIALGRHTETGNPYSLMLNGIVVSEAWSDMNIIDFSASKEGNKTLFNWKTVAEAQSSGFEVMRSADGIFFNKIDFVPSAADGGYSAGILRYNYETITPRAKRYYYRLRHIAFDGHNKFSPIIMVNGDGQNSFAITKLFPSPAAGNVALEIEAPARERLSFCITDISGRVVFFKVAEVQTGYNLVALETKNLTGGIYYIKMMCGNGEIITKQFVKQ